jgi:hypothetical protein
MIKQLIKCLVAIICTKPNILFIGYYWLPDIFQIGFFIAVIALNPGTFNRLTQVHFITTKKTLHN